MNKLLHKSLRALFLSLAVLLSLPMLAVEVEIDGINYELVAESKQATVVEKSSGDYSGEIVIPESVEHEGTAYSVTSIGKRAFSLCYGLTSVTIPNGVTSIGDNAFIHCDGLTSVTIPNSVTSIGWYAFYECSGLTSVHISDIAAWCNIIFEQVTGGIVGAQNPLYYAQHLYLNGEEVKDLVIPNSVTSIGDYAFYNCYGLTSVTIPNSVTSIGGSAFSGCYGLTSVHISDIAAWYNIDFEDYNSNPLDYAHHLYLNGEEVKDLVIPNSVTSIGDYAFAGCSGLTSVTIPNSVTSIGGDAFYNCYGLTSVHISDIAAWCNIDFADDDSNPLDYAHHLYLNGEEVKDLVIPNSVTSIRSHAFSVCSGLTSVTIPNSVTSIGDYAFSWCSGLTSVTIPNSVTSIGSSAFSWCSGLTSVTIPNSVTSIGNNAFSRCSGLTSVTIPNSVTSIRSHAFNGCSGLTSVTIPNSVTSIEYDAFSGCSGLTSVTIPNSVTSIGDWAFSHCSGLTSVIIGNSVKSIGECAFENCSGLTSVTIGNSVTRIEERAFQSCSGLTSVTIPNSVTDIREWAFSGCSGLTSVTIGNSVMSIGWHAFECCPELLDVYCYAEKVPYTDSEAFYGSYPENATLHVPAASIDSYKARDPWRDFGKIVALTPEESGIDELKGENGKVKTALYDLSGRRVQEGQKGVFIQNGKVMVR